MHSVRAYKMIFAVLERRQVMICLCRELHLKPVTRAGVNLSLLVSPAPVKKFPLGRFSSSPEEHGKARHLVVGNTVPYMYLLNELEFCS